MIILLSGALLGACMGGVEEPTEQPLASLPTNTSRPQPSLVYRAPTAIPQTPLAPLLPSPTLITAAPTETPRPTATPVCTNDLRFIEDLTVPDGMPVEGGTRIDKRWLVENAGDCNWGETYRLRLIAGPSLGAATEQALYPARGGSQVIIQILFISPNETGSYRSAWQAHTPQGAPFGDVIYLEILVQ